MKPTKFMSKSRIALSLVAAAAFVFVSMNFSSRNVSILATRSVARIIADYILNIALFFVIFYLVATAIILLYKKVFK